jgi:hypothetical protein
MEYETEIDSRLALNGFRPTNRDAILRYQKGESCQQSFHPNQGTEISFLARVRDKHVDEMPIPTDPKGNTGSVQLQFTTICNGNTLLESVKRPKIKFSANVIGKNGCRRTRIERTFVFNSESPIDQEAIGSKISSMIIRSEGHSNLDLLRWSVGDIAVASEYIQL